MSDDEEDEDEEVNVILRFMHSIARHMTEFDPISPLPPGLINGIPLPVTAIVLLVPTSNTRV